MPHSGYKSGVRVAGQLQELRASLTGSMRLTLASGVANDHELDALICAVVARMARTGQTHEIPG